MTMYARLNAAKNTSTQTTNERTDFFLENNAKTGLEGFLKKRAQKGKTSAFIHMTNEENPRSKKSGFATLSGELSVINSEEIAGVYERKDVIWIYLSCENLSIQGFQNQVIDFIDDLVMNENMAISSTLGATEADLTISWE